MTLRKKATERNTSGVIRIFGLPKPSVSSRQPDSYAKPRRTELKDNFLKKPRIVTLFKTNSLIFGLFLDTTPSSPLGFFNERLIYGVPTELRKSEARINLTHERSEYVRSELTPASKASAGSIKQLFSDSFASSTLDNVARGAYGR